MNPDPDYSAAYVELHTDDPGYSGYGLTFTIGRGNELCVAAIESLKGMVEGRELSAITEDFGGYWREICGDSQLRWVGPEKGVIHLGTAAIVNALWDLYAKTEGKPLWRLLSDMEPEMLAGCIDYRHITDALNRDEAVEILQASFDSRQSRMEELSERGYPTYTTSAGWLGYSDERLRDLCRSLMERGWSHFKIKVGRNIEDDVRRCRIIREEIGWDRKLMLDANQVWDVEEAIEQMQPLKEFKPWFIEEPTSPDDILGHARIAESVAPIRVATGEMCHNRVMFKQFLQADAMQICQIDSCRLGGVNEVLAVLLMAKKFGVPVCPHAGGVGLCEYVQHLSMFDYVRVSCSMEDRVAEYSDHLHEHFVDPIVTRGGRYMPPSAPGYSAKMHDVAIAEYAFPDGSAWKG
ncbi:MAG: enolase C-terminal domain-like protein [Pirellulaceae bacterium]